MNRALSVLPLVVSTLFADPDPRIALDDSFPALEAATYFAGEVTLVEHVNRTGILRLDRDGTINKYHWDLPHEFRMLPYGSIHLHGAPAALKDLPIGTHLHGLFYLGPEGAFEVKPPVSGYEAGLQVRPDMRSVESQFSRVLRLEDDFSFYQRQGLGWKILSLSSEPGQIVVESVQLVDGSPSGDLKLTLRVDEGTRVWKNAAFSSRDDLARGQIVQINMGWMTLLGSDHQDGLCREIWIDDASRLAATRRQRGVHLAHQKRRGIPAKVLHTESMPGHGARGHMTVQLHAGVDPALSDAIRNAKSVMIQAAEPTLRTYDNDGKPASQLEVTELEHPPAGSCGIQIRMHLYEMLEGFRPGRTVRISLPEWEKPERPREERLWQKDIRIFSVGPKAVADRDGPQPVATP